MTSHHASMSSAPLSDATNFANEQTSSNHKVSNGNNAIKNFWGTRFKSTADYQTPTSRRTRPVSTPGSGSGARGFQQQTPSLHDISNSAARNAVSDATPAVRRTPPPLTETTGFAQYKPSPLRPLFQRFLLRELHPNEQPPTLTVVFDLDETLVSNRRADLPAAILRPFCIDALHAIRKIPNLEIVLWTASTEETGGPVVQQLEENGRIFDDVIFRNELWFTEPMHTKDLRLLGRNMDRVIVFDNAPNCVKLNRFNAVLVEDFTGIPDASDETLVNLFRLLEQMVKSITVQGASVPELVRRFAEDGSNGCRTVQYALPEAWQHVSLRDISPVMVPAQGRFVRMARTSLRI